MRSMTCRRLRIALLVLALPLIAGACAAPVGAVRVDAQIVQRELTGNVLNTGELSRSTRNVLFFHGLSERFDEDSEAALDTMRKNIVAGLTGRDVFPAAAELSFFHAEASGKRSYYLAAAVHAVLSLFPPGGRSLPDPLHPRLRMAADLYNRGIALGLASPDKTVMEMRAGTHELPWGELDVAFDKDRLRWAGRDLIDFVPIAELKVSGLQVRIRRPGIGAALAAGMVPITEDQQVRDIIAPRIKVSATALLRIDDARKQLEGSRMRATLDLYPESETETVVIAGRTVPLEQEPTAALAWGLQESPVWERELKGFFGSVFQVGAKNQLVSLTPPDHLNFPEETRDLVRKALFVEPLPFVKRVIFISTPHRGSFLAARDFVRSLLQRLVSTPARLVKGTAELLANREAFAAQGGNRLPTAVDNMSPRNPFVKTLSVIPIDPGVDAHSIIAVKGDGPVETGDDGVVKYESAHIEC